MTLEELQQLVESNAQSIAALAQENRETRALADSNARAIEALANHTAEARDQAEEERSELRVGINELRASMADLMQLARRNEVEHQLFRLRFEAIDPLSSEGGEQ